LKPKSSLRLVKTTPLGDRTIGYCCVPDIRDPLTLTEHAVLAEKAGFGAIWASDHFHPWAHTNAHESNTWIWMTSALARVKRIPFGTAITAPILRYHPAIVAQAFATMRTIFGPRVMLGIGTGEAMNEVPLGMAWPSLGERRERVIEAIQIIKRLWKEEFVTFRGKYYALNSANLYTNVQVPIFVAGFGPKMARLAGRLGDGFLTVIKPIEYIKHTLFPSVVEGARESGRTFEDITKVIELDVSYDQDYDRALAPLRFWRATLIDDMYSKPISDPREIEKMGEKVSDKQLAEAYLVSTTPEEHIKKIEEAFEAGFDHVYVQSNSPDEQAFIEMYREKVIPYFSTKGEKER
jgi:coenzyme F420-dependent glucose-6-phosphate dehydrogenase